MALTIDRSWLRSVFESNADSELARIVARLGCSDYLDGVLTSQLVCWSLEREWRGRKLDILRQARRNPRWRDYLQSWARRPGGVKAPLRWRVLPPSPSSPLRIDRSIYELLGTNEIAQSVSFVAPAPRDRLEWDLPLRIEVLGERTDLMEHEVEYWAHAEWARGRSADILFVNGTLRETALRLLSGARRRADLVVILRGGSEIHDPLLETVRGLVDAGGVAVAASGASEGRVVQKLLFELAHDAPLDKVLWGLSGGRPDAYLSEDLVEMARARRSARRLSDQLAAAGLSLGDLPKHLDTELERLDPDTEGPESIRPARLRVRNIAERGEFARESDEASLVANLRRRLVRVFPAAAERGMVAGPPPDAARYLQGRIDEANGAALQTGQRYNLTVFVGPKEAGTATASSALPPLPDEEDETEVTVAFIPLPAFPGEAVRGSTRRMVIRRSGRGDDVPFPFTVGSGERWRGRVSILHRNLVLQSTLFEAAIGTGPLALKTIDTVIDEALRGTSRAPFDTALVFNHAGDASIAYGYADHRVDLEDLGGARDAISQLAVILDEFIPAEKRGPKGLKPKAMAELLRMCARHGRLLWGSIRRLFPEGFEDLQEQPRLHVVGTSPDKLVPIEMAYLLAAPHPKTAKLCKDWTDGLETGRCPACGKRGRKAQRKVVCPLGFLGLRAVIERAVRGAPSSAPPVPLSRAVALGASKRVDAEKTTPLVSDTLESALDQLAGRVYRISNQDTWDSVAGSRPFPSWFVLLPHNAIEHDLPAMELGDDRARVSSPDIDIQHIRDRTEPVRPLVLLVGCETSTDELPYRSWASRMIDLEAGAVLATISTVDGPYSGAAVKRLVKALPEAISEDSQSFGEILLRTKRALIADGDPLPMTFATFGNVDLQLEASE